MATNSMERVLLENLRVAQLVKKFPASYGIRRFVTCSEESVHLIPTLRDKFSSRLISIRSSLILSSRQCQLFYVVSSILLIRPKVCIQFSFPMRSTSLTHLILFHLITLMISDTEHECGDIQKACVKLSTAARPSRLRRRTKRLPGAAYYKELY
jgi:hypothetical protein